LSENDALGDAEAELSWHKISADLLRRLEDLACADPLVVYLIAPPPIPKPQQYPLHPSKPEHHLGDHHPGILVAEGVVGGEFVVAFQS
jgi:hypothetical protein